MSERELRRTLLTPYREIQACAAIKKGAEYKRLKREVRSIYNQPHWQGTTQPQTLRSYQKKQNLVGRLFKSTLCCCECASEIQVYTVECINVTCWLFSGMSHSAWQWDWGNEREREQCSIKALQEPSWSHPSSTTSHLVCETWDKKLLFQFGSAVTAQEKVPESYVVMENVSGRELSWDNSFIWLISRPTCLLRLSRVWVWVITALYISPQLLCTVRSDDLSCRVRTVMAVMVPVRRVKCP